MKKSAGILVYRFRDEIEFFLVHPGGPFFKNKDEGSWGIPKGLYEDDEEPLSAARREFLEETGYHTEGNFIPLSAIKQKGGKIVIAWAVEQELDETAITSNTFEMVWPPKSGKSQAFPEIDKAGWFKISEAKKKMLEAQIPLLNELISKL